MSCRRSIVFILACWICSAVQCAQVFVDPSGHDTHGDGTIEFPYKSIQAAIDNAWDYDVIVLMPVCIHKVQK
jgi:hypothetical protein